MCTSPKVPAAPPPPVPPPPPPPAPPPPEPTAEAVQTEGPGRTAAQQDQQQTAKKQGAKDLRIDVNLAQPGGKGLNIPRG